MDLEWFVPAYGLLLHRPKGNVPDLGGEAGVWEKSGEGSEWTGQVPCESPYWQSN